ncbi:MAG: peptidoglycan editing factor PgeF [Deltaproteobacteria bacterium]|nr:peptidoglycan editing factor PgeF [Deltaproteobacteria bacterium]
MRIGIVGAGMIGGTLAKLWQRAGHQIMLSSRSGSAGEKASALGKGVSAGKPAKAAEFGEVVVLAVPMRAVPDLGAELAPIVAGKIVIDTGNAIARRDGKLAQEALAGPGSGAFTAKHVPGARVVKAFNTVYFKDMLTERKRKKRIAVPLAGDSDAVGVVEQLVEDAGMAPVVVGPLEAARRFDHGTEVWNKGMTAAELRRALFRRDQPEGELVVYRSHLIDESVFTHGFPERHGGLSKDLRTSLNVGYRWGDDESVVIDNRRLVAQSVGYDPQQLVVTKHVHGTRVWTVGGELPDPPEYDGLVTDQVGPVLGAFAADCVPIVFGDPDARVCGALHAGWRGTVNGAAVEVVKAMKALGADPERIRVALGPSIGPCCFEVGPEVVAEFRSKLGEVAGLVVAGPNKEHIDLRIANRFLLERAGVAPEHIDDSPPCTKCNPERFFSYRRDGFLGGVHMGFIGLR